MLADEAVPRPFSARRTDALNGRLAVPGDKSICHRALMLGAAARGRTSIANLVESPDVLATLRAMQALGARIEKTGGAWTVDGLGVGGFLTPTGPLDFGNSGTGVRLAMGLLAPCHFESRFVGDATLSTRPMRRILAALRGCGVELVSHDDGRLPITLRGARTPLPLSYRAPVASAQVKSSVLLAGLSIPGITTVIESGLTRDHTENLLGAFGAQVDIQTSETGERTIALTGLPDLRGQHIHVPGDPSLAAFIVVAGLIISGSDITVENVLMNPTRTALIDTLIEMGGDIAVNNQRMSSGELVADLHVRGSRLRGMTLSPERAQTLMEDYPILAVAAAFAEGMTLLPAPGQGHGLERDRLAAIARGLGVHGVSALFEEQGLRIVGANGRVPGGGLVTTGRDHRMAMAFLVMGLGSHQPSGVDDIRGIAMSFPDFISGLQSLGAKLTPGQTHNGAVT